jgi:alcohol dehydrogenase YqhD (iron-dependent ADH family)
MPARPDKYVELGQNVFNLAFDTQDIEHAAKISIDAMKGWLASIGRCLTFTDLGIDDSKFEIMADDVIRLYGRDKGYLPNPKPIDKAGVLEIFRLTL